MTRTVEALRAAADAGVDSSENVTEALSHLIAIVEKRLDANEAVSESDLDVAIAVIALSDAVRPPGLDPEWIPPGQGGIPPGQDPLWTPPGQNDDFVPPGHDSDIGSPSDTAPGQTKDPNPNKGSGNSNGNGKP